MFCTNSIVQVKMGGISTIMNRRFTENYVGAEQSWSYSTIISCCFDVLERSVTRHHMKVICCRMMQFLPLKRGRFLVLRDYIPTPHGPRWAALHWKWRRRAAWRRYSHCWYTILVLNTRGKRYNHSLTAARSTYRYVGLCSDQWRI